MTRAATVIKIFVGRGYIGLHNRFGVKQSALCTSDIRLSYNYGEKLRSILRNKAARRQ